MRNKKLISRIVLSAFFVALGVVLPMAFHMIPKAGSIFLPMHIPTFLGGLCCGPLFGALIGILSCTISCLATGMPPVAIYPAMVVELCFYGFFSGLFIRIFKTKNKYINVYLTLIISMLIGRSINGLINGLILRTANYSMLVWLTASFVTSLPGIVIQLILIPTLFLTLEKSHVLDISNENAFGFFNKKRVKKESTIYFNSLAKDWDKYENITEKEIEDLLGVTNLQKNEKVLDLACGTGILEPYLIKKGVNVIGIDISNEMINIAKQKYPNVIYTCQDFYDFEGKDFDKIIIFNAYPHFINRDLFALKAGECLKENGKLFIIHNECKEKINSYHVNSAKNVSRELLSPDEEAIYLKKYFDINETKDDKNYLIVCTKKHG